MRFLRQATSVDVPIGPFLDSTDGVTAETALTITQPDVRLKKNGGAWAQKAAAQTLTHEENGYYEVTLDATDTDTVGLLRVNVSESGALPVWEDFQVLEEAVYDALFASAAAGYQVPIWAAANSTVNLSGTTVATVTTTTTATNVTTVNGLAANVVTAAAVADGAIDRATFAADTGLQPARSGTAQAGSASDITLDASASATDNLYKYAYVYLTGGTGAGQYRFVTGYNGTTKVASVEPDWTTQPDATTTFAVLPSGGIADVELYGGVQGVFSSGTPYVLLTSGAHGSSSSTLTLQKLTLTNAAGNALSISSSNGFKPVLLSNGDGGDVLDIAGNVNELAGLLADAVCDEALSGHATAGTLGAAVSDILADTGTDGVVVAAGSKTGYAISGTITTLDALDTAQDTQHATTQAAIADVPTNAELTTALNTLLTTAMTESYNADGAAPTPAQALFVIMQMLTEMSIAGTTMTVKKLDGATTAFTLTLNDATTPTSVTRAT